MASDVCAPQTGEVNPEFLTAEDVLELHRLQLERYGGAAWLRDKSLLESALARPEGAFGGEYLHCDLARNPLARLLLGN